MLFLGKNFVRITELLVIKIHKSKFLNHENI